jgi:glycosyltransferase involved in cell wall biosynthesis
MPKPHILITIKTLGMGGAERLLAYAALRLARSARFTYSLCFLSEPATLVGEITRAGVAASCLGFHRSFPMPGAWSAFKEAIRRADLVHAHLPVAGFFSLLATGKKPVVYTEHTLPRHHHPLTRLVERWTLRRYARVVAPSRAVADAVSRPARKRVDVIENAVDLSRFDGARPADDLPVSLGALVVLVLGRLVPEKDPAAAVRIMGLIRRRVPEAHLLFAGEGALQGECQREIERLGLTGEVHLLGVRADIPRLLARAQVVLNTSRVEGHSVALIEAQTAGRPVVAPHIGGIPETILSGRTGLLYPVSDEAAAARCVAELLTDVGQRRRMGRAARQHACERFDISHWVERHEQLYEQVLHQAVGGSRSASGVFAGAHGVPRRRRGLPNG